MSAELQLRLDRRIRELGSVVVAFSGGVDSSLVAALSVSALGSSALAVTAVSPALASGELDGACEVARAVGIRHELIETDELASEDYRRNDRFRCFHCKSELYSRLSALAAARGYRALLSGANADDAGDWRPGLRAAAEHGVRHPLLEASVGKDQVRALAQHLGVPSADKPASPCLASRLPYGTPVSADVLSQVDRAELSLKQRGYRDLRVRHFGDLGDADSPISKLVAERAGYPLMPEFDYKPVNRYLPPRPRRDGCDAKPESHVPPETRLDQDQLPGVLRWLDRALSR